MKLFAVTILSWGTKLTSMKTTAAFADSPKEAMSKVLSGITWPHRRVHKVEEVDEHLPAVKLLKKFNIEVIQ